MVNEGGYELTGRPVADQNGRRSDERVGWSGAGVWARNEPGWAFCDGASTASTSTGPLPPADADRRELNTMRSEWTALASVGARERLRASAHARQFVVLHIRPMVWLTAWVLLMDLAELRERLRYASDLHDEQLIEHPEWGWWNRPGYLIEVPRALFGTVHNLLQGEPDLTTHALVPNHLYTVFHVVHTPVGLQPGQPVRPSRLLADYLVPAPLLPVPER